MRLSWNGEGTKFYPASFAKPHSLSLMWWQNLSSNIVLESVSRYLLQSNKNDTAVPGRHRNMIILNIAVKGYTLYAGTGNRGQSLLSTRK